MFENKLSVSLAKTDGMLPLSVSMVHLVRLDSRGLVELVQVDFRIQGRFSGDLVCEGSLKEEFV